MKKYFIPLLATAVALLGAWMFYRHQIWERTVVSPAETVLKFSEGRAFFLIALRTVTLAFWAWAAVILWRTGLARFTWLAVLAYAVFELLEFIGLEAAFFQYKKLHNLWEGGFAVNWLLGIFTAAMVLIFNGIAVGLMKYWRKQGEGE